MDAKRSLRSLVAAALLSSVAVAIAPVVAEAQWIICWIYPDSTTDEWSDFCYGRGSGYADCVIFEYSTGGGGGLVDPLSKGAAAASGVSRLGDQGANQPVGLTSGTGLPRLDLNDAVCKEPRLHNPARTARSEHVPAARKDRLRTRRVRELTR